MKKYLLSSYKELLSDGLADSTFILVRQNGIVLPLADEFTDYRTWNTYQDYTEVYESLTLSECKTLCSLLHLDDTPLIDYETSFIVHKYTL